MIRHPSFVSGAVVAGLIALAGCDKFTDALEQSAEAVAAGAAAAGEAAAGAGQQEMTPDDLLGEKLNGYIECINGASKKIHDTANRYYDWVDHDKGVTGKERHIYGLYDVDEQKACVEGITKSNELEPDMPDLEKVGSEYLAALQTIQPLIAEAYTYYNESNYKDDKFAKGLELHPKLVAGWAAFETADIAMRTLVKDSNEALHERELVRVEKEQGRKLLFLTKNVMALAKKLMIASESETLDSLDLDGLQAALTAYEAGVDELDKYIKDHKAEADSVTTSWFTTSAAELKQKAKDLMRRKRDNKQYTKSDLEAVSGPWGAEGHPATVSKAFNDLIDQSNGLNWNFYKPDP